MSPTCARRFRRVRSATWSRMPPMWSWSRRCGRWPPVRAPIPGRRAAGPRGCPGAAAGTGWGAVGAGDEGAAAGGPRHDQRPDRRAAGGVDPHRGDPPGAHPTQARGWFSRRAVRLRAGARPAGRGRRRSVVARSSRSVARPDGSARAQAQHRREGGADMGRDRAVRRVEGANSGLAGGDLDRTCTLLEQSIGARPHLDTGDVPAARETSMLGSGGLALVLVALVMLTALTAFGTAAEHVE